MLPLLEAGWSPKGAVREEEDKGSTKAEAESEGVDLKDGTESEGSRYIAWWEIAILVLRSQGTGCRRLYTRKPELRMY